MSERPFVIVGASLAGARAAAELRARGFDGRLVLIGAEPEPPYERPPLSKECLRGEWGRDRAWVHPPGFYAEQDIELITATTVTAVDPGARTVTTDDGRLLEFEKLLIATGAEPRRLQVPGAELDGVHYLRTLGDCDAMRARLVTGAHVAVIGAGWIGSEVAAAARQRGCEVTLMDPLRLPNEHALGAEIGEFYRDVHARNGVRLLLGDGVVALEGDGAVRRVRTATGKVVGCDLAVVGIGATPRVELAQAAGIAIENGIATDERLLTSAADVYAAGDVARAYYPFYGRPIRVEHWANALRQGPAAARAMLGVDGVYDELPYFYSHQYEIGMEYSGFVTAWDHVVFRGERESGAFIAFWVHEGRVQAGMNVNVWDVNEDVQALIRSRRQVDIRALADPDTPLASLVGEATASEAPRG